MRVSVDPTDHGYTGPCPGARVFFNGAEVRGVFTADEEARLIVQADFDADGHCQLAPCGTKVLTITRSGDVRIELPPGVERDELVACSKAHNAKLTGSQRDDQ